MISDPKTTPDSRPRASPNAHPLCAAFMQRALSPNGLPVLVVLSPLVRSSIESGGVTSGRLVSVVEPCISSSREPAGLPAAPDLFVAPLTALKGTNHETNRVPSSRPPRLRPRARRTCLCGFTSGRPTPSSEQASQVVLRDGDRTVLTMANDYEGHSRIRSSFVPTAGSEQIHVAEMPPSITSMPSLPRWSNTSTTRAGATTRPLAEADSCALGAAGGRWAITSASRSRPPTRR